MLGFAVFSQPTHVHRYNLIIISNIPRALCSHCTVKCVNSYISSKYNITYVILYLLEIGDPIIRLLAHGYDAITRAYNYIISVMLDTCSSFVSSRSCLMQV